MLAKVALIDCSFFFAFNVGPLKSLGHTSLA